MIGSAHDRISRWDPTPPLSSFHGLATVLPPTLTKEQLEAYAIRFRIEEIQVALTALRNGTYPFKKSRSPSPEPIYDSNGKRVNTRDNRKRDQLTAEQRQLIQQAFKINPSFKPPVGYQPTVKKTKKIYVPVRQYPDYNFIGQIIGPRGYTVIFLFFRLTDHR